jgi:hypothetical protein
MNTLALAKSRTVEWTIINKILDAIAAQGWHVSVRDSYDGEGDLVVQKCQSKERILAAMFSTEGDLLLIHSYENHGHFRLLGHISFIHGNGEDVIHSWSDVGPIDALVTAILDDAEALARAHRASRACDCEKCRATRASASNPHGYATRNMGE